MKSETLRKCVQQGISVLNEVEAREVLREYDIPCPVEVTAEFDLGKTGKDYLAELKKLGMPSYPVFMKVVSRDIRSKTDVGGVFKVRSSDEAVTAIDRILENVKKMAPSAKIQGILASQDVSDPQGREVFLGSIRDEIFGHVISLGFGGVFVEVYKDVEFRVPPLTKADVYEMIDGLKGKQILYEFRGMKPANLELLVDTTLKFSKMIEENSEIAEIDVNPLILTSERIFAVDTLIRI